MFRWFVWGRTLKIFKVDFIHGIGERYPLDRKRLTRSLFDFFSLLFILSFAAVLLLNSLTPAKAQFIPFSPITQAPRAEIRGVWMTNIDISRFRDRAKVQDAVSQLRRLNFNTIYPAVWNSGYVLYKSAVAQRTGIQPFVLKGTDGQDIIGDLIAQAHNQGLLAIPWFEFGFMVPPTSELALNHPEWLTQTRNGGQTSDSTDGEMAWLNPFHPQVQQFITDLVLEIVTQYDVDGIQFDDHMSLPQEFGYDKNTVAVYNLETNHTGLPNPQAADWIRWRANRLTQFMIRLNQAVKARKPKAIFSVSPNYFDYAYKFQLQDWLTWINLNLVDELIVQVYRSNLQSLVENISRPEIQAAQQILPTAIGIMTGLRNSPVSLQQIQSQVRAVQQRGLGVTFFYYETLWDYAPESVAERQAGFENLFPNSALRARAE